jgi:cobalamin-dependent methionine synthase I
MRIIARLFRYTRTLEQEVARVSRLHEMSEQMHHGEIDRLKSEKTTAETRSTMLQEELDRRERLLHKLSDQNYGLTERLCVKAGVAPLSEALTQPKLTNEEQDERSAKIDAARSTGPVAKLRAQQEAAYIKERDEEQSLAAKAAATHNAQRPLEDKPAPAL